MRKQIVSRFLKLFSFFIVIALIVPLGLHIATPHKISAASEDKALYIWWYGYEILEHQTERDNLFRIAQAEQITDIYVSVGVDTVNWFTPGYRGVTNAWATLISQAKARGIGVHGILSGTAPDEFINTAAHTSYVQKILKYNIENPTNKFEGINWDFEPLVTNHVALYTSYIRAMKAVSYGGQTVVSQGLVLSVYLDPPRWLNINKYTQASYDSIRALYREFNLIDVNSYSDTLANVIYQAADGPQVCQELGIKFHIGLETDNRPYAPGTLFEEGKDAYHALQAEVSAYYQPRFTMFTGQFIDHYDHNINRFYMITAATFPQGQYQPGQTVTVNATLRRSDSYTAEAFGVKLRIRNSSSAIQEVSKIVVIEGTETRQVSLTWTIPSNASGSYDFELSTWDIDTPSRGSTLLTTDFGGNKAALEALTMAQLEARTGLTGKRVPFVSLDHTDWKNDYVTLPGTTPPPPTTSTPPPTTTTTTPPPPTTTSTPSTPIDVGSGAQDYNNHFGAGYTMVDANNPANASGVIDTVDIWAYSNLTGVKVGVFYLVNGNILSARGTPVSLGNVVGGSKKTFTGLSLPIQAGDFIGIYMANGDIEYSTNIAGGIVYEKAGDFTSSSNVTFTPAGTRHIGLGGYATTTSTPSTPIDVGSGAQEYNNHFGAGYTMVDANNPANASGVIDTVDIWAYSNLTGVKVGVFYLVNGNILSARGTPVSLGNVVGGSKKTFTGLSLPIQAGDFIGIYMANGDIEYSTNIAGGIVYEKAGDFTSSSNVTFTPAGTRHIGLGGYATTTSTPSTPIDVGSGAQEYNNHFGAGYTMVDANNPANASGVIDTVDIWAYSNLTGVKVGVFYLVNGNILSARGTPVSLGNVVGGSKKTFTGLSLPIQAGDFIGIYMANGDIEYSTNIAGGIVYEKAGDFTSSSNVTFTPAGTRHIAIFGYNTI